MGKTFSCVLRIDTTEELNYVKHGNILNYVFNKVIN